jgi:hypothetical protein
MTRAAMDLEQAKLDPASVFHAPQDVLGAPGLSPEDKKSILVRWEADVEALLRATEEGMPPADNRSPAELLRAVQDAIQSLEHGQSAHRG